MTSANRAKGNLKENRGTPTEMARRRPKSVRAAIKAKCWECSNFQVHEVRLCTVTGCPLYNHRPWKTKEEAE